MSTLAHYHPREIDIDLADLPTWLYAEIASLHGRIDPPPAEPVLTCLGNGTPMYVYRHESGRYFARHYPGGNLNGHSHRIATMSDAHRRQTEYCRRAAESDGLHAVMEMSTGGRTRLDLAVTGATDVGFEIQRSGLSRVKAKTRARRSFDAGWPTAWITDRERDPDWADHVPTGRLTTRGIWDHAMPRPGSAGLTIADFTRERDRTAPTGWRYMRQPKSIRLDELPVRMAAAEIVPVAVGALGRVDLAFASAAEIIDSCTFPGASVWHPTDETPRRKEAAQRITTVCARHSDDPVRTCLTCGKPLIGGLAQFCSFTCMGWRG